MQECTVEVTGLFGVWSCFDFLGMFVTAHSGNEVCWVTTEKKTSLKAVQSV